MMRKVFKMRSAGQASKTIPGGVGPLKTEENKTIRQQTLPRTRPRVPSGTVADICITSPPFRYTAAPVGYNTNPVGYNTTPASCNAAPWLIYWLGC